MAVTTPRTIDPVGALCGLGIPVVSALAVLVLTAVWRPRLPAEIATHWTATTADSFGSPTSAALTMALLIVLIGGGCSAPAAFAQAQLMMRRYLLVAGLTVTFLMVAVHIATLASQLDVRDPATVRFPAWSLGVGTVVGVAVGWWAASRLRDYRVRTVATRQPDPSLPRGRVELPIVEQVGTDTRTTAVLALLTGIPVAIVCAALHSLWPVVVAAPLVLLVLSLLRFTVTVDTRGLSVRNLGADAVEYGIEEITGAAVTQTRPFRDWGGWGMRMKGRGRYGLVTNSGPALVVSTASGHEFTVTAARAEEMAGALNTLADRRAHT